MQKTKVTLLSFYSGQISRGVETWASELKRFSTNFEIDIVGSSNNIYWKIPFVSFVLHSLLATFKMISADVVVATNGTLQTFWARLITFMFRKPLVVFGHSGPGRDDKINLLCMPNIFVAFSDSQKKWAEKYAGKSTRVVKINHAIDTDLFKPSKRPYDKSVLCVAANIPSKRVGLVREAVSTLSGYKYIGIGQGNGKVVGYKDMPKIYQEADIFCFVPESWEAFGLVYLEAMASGIPVVAPKDAVRQEIIGDAGVLVDDPTNVQKLAQAIESAYNKKWGDKPRAQAMKFSWKTTIQKYEELFHSV